MCLEYYTSLDVRADILKHELHELSNQNIAPASQMRPCSPVPRLKLLINVEKLTSDVRKQKSH